MPLEAGAELGSVLPARNGRSFPPQHPGYSTHTAQSANCGKHDVFARRSRRKELICRHTSPKPACPAKSRSHFLYQSWPGSIRIKEARALVLFFSFQTKRLPVCIRDLFTARVDMRRRGC
jgi:hypothetical protein